MDKHKVTPVAPGSSEKALAVEGDSQFYIEPEESQ